MFVLSVSRLVSRRCHNIPNLYPLAPAPCRSVWTSRSFASGSPGWLLNQLDSSDFAWRNKNLLWDEFNIEKGKLDVKNKKAIEDYRFKSRGAKVDLASLGDLWNRLIRIFSTSIRTEQLGSGLAFIHSSS
jgi:hypothetical protein